jgi:hypothetical protein
LALVVLKRMEDPLHKPVLILAEWASGGKPKLSAARILGAIAIILLAQPNSLHCFEQTSF